LSTKTDNISELCKHTSFLHIGVTCITDTCSARFSGILRGQESFSQAVSFGINTKEWKGGRVPLAVNTILLGLAVVPTWIALQEHVPVEGPKEFDEVSSVELAKEVPHEGDRVKYSARQTTTEV
jgi:hypothetical protein